jgi:hypothetical protein
VDIWTYESVEYVTVAGEAWLASASEYPRSLKALWAARPWAPTVLPCGRVFDVVNLPGLFGRRVLDELWTSGPGCGPAATYRGRILLFAQVGTAQRLRSLLTWEEWARDVPPILCHGPGDAVTVPPVQRMADAHDTQDAHDPAAALGGRPGIPDASASPAGRVASGAVGPGLGRWIVAPDTREPWLPGAAVLLRTFLHIARSGPDELPPAPEPLPLAPTDTFTAAQRGLLHLLPDSGRPAETDF